MLHGFFPDESNNCVSENSISTLSIAVMNTDVSHVTGGYPRGATVQVLWRMLLVCKRRLRGMGD